MSPGPFVSLSLALVSTPISLSTLPQGPIMHTDHTDLVLDEEGALETKVSIERGGAPFCVYNSLRASVPSFFTLLPEEQGQSPLCLLPPASSIISPSFTALVCIFANCPHICSSLGLHLEPQIRVHFSCAFPITVMFQASWMPPSGCLPLVASPRTLPLRSHICLTSLQTCPTFRVPSLSLSSVPRTCYSIFLT